MATIATSIQLYDRVSAPISHMLGSISNIISAFESVDDSMNGAFNTNGIDVARQHLEQVQSAVESLSEEMSGANLRPQPIPFEWSTDDLNVFTETGIERFQQEVASTNQMLTALGDRQNQIAENATRTDIFSDNAIRDISSMTQRIQVIQQRIQQIESNPLNMGADHANGELEQLRSQLNQALQAQQSLNRAVQNMDVESANSAYNQLSRTVANTERYIRDNVDEQGRFTNEVRNSANAADGLTGKIMGMVGAYASLQGIQKLVNLSDEYTRTTARLRMIVDEQSNVEELQNKIFASAQRSRASYADTADMIAKISQRTGDLFTNDEAIVFTENLNKLYKVAGASQQEMHSSQLQLTQALGSGVLRGEEFNAVFEAAPNIMQTVADYMGVPIGKMREMAADGQITANIVKNAMLGATSDINNDFNSIPMTWSDVWTSVANRLYMASQPILSVISWLADKWSILEPIVLGVAAALLVYLGATKGVELATKAWAAAQAFFNSVMALNPVYLIIMGIILLIALIYAVVAAINKATGKTISATGVIVGSIMTAVAFVWNIIVGVINAIIQFLYACFVEPFIGIVEWILNVCQGGFDSFGGAVANLIGQIISWFLSLGQVVTRIIDAIFGTNWTGGLESLKSKVIAWGKTENAITLDRSTDSMMLQRWEYGDAYKTGYDWGSKFGSSVSDAFGTEDLLGDKNAANLAETAENTGKIADSVDISSEDLKYLRDIAERDVINRFTTAEIKVDMQNNNTINSDMDLDGIVDHLATGVNEAMEKAAEGVHV